MTLGLNTNFGNVNSFGMMGGQSNVDYNKLNTYTNSIMNQVNSMSYSPLGEMSMTNAMPSWFTQLMGCFSFTGMSSIDNKDTTKTTFMDVPVADKTSGTDKTPGTDKTTETDKGKTAIVEKEEKSKKVRQEASKICEECYVAIKGAGTDEKKLKSALSKVTKDNVLEVMETYIKNYSADMKGETLIESIQNEFSGGWFGSELENITNNLKDKLAERAIEMDLVEEAGAFRGKVTTENNRTWNTRDEEVSKHFNVMLAAMITKRTNG